MRTPPADPGPNACTRRRFSKASVSRAGDRKSMPLTRFHCPSQHRQNPLASELGAVDTQERGSRLRDAEHISRRQHDILLKASTRDDGRIVAVRQAAPEIESTP